MKSPFGHNPFDKPDHPLGRLFLITFPLSAAHFPRSPMQPNLFYSLPKWISPTKYLFTIKIRDPAADAVALRTRPVAHYRTHCAKHCLSHVAAQNMYPWTPKASSGVFVWHTSLRYLTTIGDFGGNWQRP